MEKAEGNGTWNLWQENSTKEEKMGVHRLATVRSQKILQ